MKIVPTVIFPPETRLLGVSGFRPEGFAHGIEILNDDRTSMEFVVSTLREHLGLDEEAAVESMLDIHTKGGVLLKLESAVEAERVAALVASRAKEQDFPLVCRAVSVLQGSVADVRDARQVAKVVYRGVFGDWRLLRGVWQGLTIAFITLLVLGASGILQWITGRSFVPDAIAPIGLSLAIAMAVKGVAAEYVPYSGRSWGFVLSGGGVLLFFALVILWAHVNS